MDHSEARDINHWQCNTPVFMEALLEAMCGFAELQTRVSLILLFILSQPNSPWTSVMSDRGSGGNAII